MCREHQIRFASENKIEIGYQIKELWRRRNGLGDTFTLNSDIYHVYINEKKK